MSNETEGMDLCPKWNKLVSETSCNICKTQCDHSVADPDNFIANKLILDPELVKHNRQRNCLEENAETENMDFLRNEIENNFRDKASILIDSLGLSHIRVRSKDENI